MKKGILFTLLFPWIVQAAGTAGYYRLWQGFKKAELSSSAFQAEIPNFMNTTLNLYQSHLNNYLVVIPPSHKPEFVPDELAIVALQSQQIYEQIRATPEGQAYGESHWRIFDSQTSKSAPYSFKLDPQLTEYEHNKAYDLMGQAIDWRSGSSFVYIGIRKSSLSSSDFRKALVQINFKASQEFQKWGLDAFLVIANDNYEIVYTHWKSREGMIQAYSSAGGRDHQLQQQKWMETLQWTEAQPFNGQSIEPHSFYSTVGN